MFKLMTIVLIFILCSIAGFLYSEKFKLRYYQLKACYKSITLLQNEVVFSSTPLPEAFKEVGKKSESLINIILNQVSVSLESGIDMDVYSSFKRVYENNKNDLYLEKEDLNVMGDLFKSLGESGVYGQDKIFNLTLENLRINIDESFEECKKNTKLYKYLGVCIGAMISILLL